MKITKLVIRFNQDKIIVGLVLSFLLIVCSFYFSNFLSTALKCLGFLIIINILAALFASYILYDRSYLYNPHKLLEGFQIKKQDYAILLHASFDPVSRSLESIFDPFRLLVYNIYGNRHEDEKSIAISNKVFPPRRKEIKFDPTQLPNVSDSVDYIIAITALHEIQEQEKRVAFFKEARRILKPDGKIIMCEQMRNTVNFLFFSIGVFHFVSMQNWKDAITSADLKLIEKKNLTPFAHILTIGL